MAPQHHTKRDLKILFPLFFRGQCFFPAGETASPFELFPAEYGSDSSGRTRLPPPLRRTRHDPLKRPPFDNHPNVRVVFHPGRAESRDVPDGFAGCAAVGKARDQGVAVVVPVA
jgi:hypothetical protein